MHTIRGLEKQLTFDEYQIGKALFSEMKEAGIASSKAAAMCYRAGRVDAKREARERRKQILAERQEAEKVAAEEQLTETTSPPEANTEPTPATDEEGSTDHE